MKFNDIKGQNRAVRLLKGAIEKKRIANAYLFSGPQGVGKFSAAKTFAAALLCEQEKIGSCGACLSCRKLAGGVHPDFLVIQKEGANIKIDQIREIKKIIQFGPHEAPYKVLIIQDADEMSPEAAHSFLKILEEPTDRVVFILTTARSPKLPPTILSRCQIILFNELSEDLKKQSAKSGAAEIKPALEKINKKEILGILKLSSELTNLKDQIEDILSGLMHHYYLQLGQDLSQIRSIRIILDALRKIKQNANLHLTLDNMLLKLAEV